MEDNNSNKVKEPIAAYSTNSYDDVMMMLYTMPITEEVKKHVGLRLVEEATNPVFSAIFSSIEEMSKLKDGWAGEGSYAVSKRVMNNLKSVLLISNDSDWADWVVGPDVNATVGLQSKTSRAYISLGEDEFSYFMRKDGERVGKSHVVFTPKSFLEILNKLSKKSV